MYKKNLKASRVILFFQFIFNADKKLLDALIKRPFKEHSRCIVMPAAAERGCDSPYIKPFSWTKADFDLIVFQFFEEKDDCPSVFCDAAKGRVVIEGKSIPESPKEEIYGPIYDWLRIYAENPLPQTSVHIKLDYFNTGSSKCLRDLFLILEGMQDLDTTNVIINWYYEEDDEDMLEDGEEFSEKINLPFRMVVNEKEYS